MASTVQLEELRVGTSGERWRELQAAVNRRLRARGLDSHCVKEDGEGGPLTMAGVRTAAWILGAQSDTYNALIPSGRVPIGVQRMIRNPGRRTAEQRERAKVRLSHLQASNEKRKRIVRLALKAAENYRANPTAYHYRCATEIANLIYLEPSPADYRSDCSQFVAAVYADAGLPSPGYPASHKYTGTSAIVQNPHAKLTAHPRPGDLGMYGNHTGPLNERWTHHVELYCGQPGATFIGHGSPPIDPEIPGPPDFYVTFDFLE